MPARQGASLVDDEKDLSDTVSFRLRHAGYEIIFAYDGFEAIEKVRKEKPDLIILDLMLPKLDGYKVCRMLKFDEQYKNIPSILFSVKVQESDKQLGEEVVADTYLAKPFEPAVLFAKIKELLKEQQAIGYKSPSGCVARK